MGTTINGLLLADDEAAVHTQLTAASVATALTTLQADIATAYAAWTAAGYRDRNAWNQQLKAYCAQRGFALPT